MNGQSRFPPTQNNMQPAAPHSIRIPLFRFLLLLIASFGNAVGAEQDDEFTVLAEVQRETPGAVAFSYKLLFAEGNYSGFCVGAPILTASHMARVEYGYPEAGSQPWPALKIYFTKQGVQRLNEHFKLKPEDKLILFMEGRACTQMDADLIRNTIKSGWIGVLLPRTPNEHEDLVRLAKKLAKPPKKK